MNHRRLRDRLRDPVVVYSLAAVLVAAAVLLITALAGWSARVEFVVGVALVAAVTLLSLQQLGDSLDTTAWRRRRPQDADSSSLEFTEDRVIFLETRLVLSTKDTRVFKSRVQPALAEIVRQRLRSSHGIDAEQHPDRARETAGEPLWRFVTEDREEPVTGNELLEAVDRIERLSAHD